MNKEKRALIGFSTGHFFLDLYAAILIPLYPFIAQRLDINIATISLVIAIGHSISSILQPVFGFISDKLHKRFFMFWGLIFSSVFIPLGYIAPNAVILTLCLMLGMIGNAFYHPQVTKIIKDFYQTRQGLSKAIGIFLGLGTIGYAIGPYFSTYVIQIFGEKNYVYIGLIGILTAFFILFFVPKIEKTEVVSNNNFLDAIKEILKNKACIFLILITVIKSALVMSFGTYIPFLLKGYDFSIIQIGFILTLFYIAGGISMIISSAIEKHAGLYGMIALSYVPLLPLVLLLLYFLKYNKMIALILIILTGFFVLLVAGVVLAQAQRLISGNTGTISGIIQGFTLALGALLLIPFGLIAQKYGVASVLIIITLTAFIFGLCALRYNKNS